MMERLRQINQLLKADQLEEAIGELLRMADQSEARRSLLILRNRLKTLDHKKLHALIEEADWKRERQHIRRELLDILHDLDRDEAPAPTTAPTPKGGGIFDRAVEMFRKRWPKTKPSSRPPSPRFPSRHKDKGGSIPDRSTGSASGGFEPPEDPAPPPPPAPAPAPQEPSMTNVGGVQNPFRQGKILYSIPPNMKLAEEVRCTIRIATKDIQNELLRAGLSEKEKEDATQEGIQITQVMKVELVEANAADPSFKIVARNSAEQPILPFMPTEWSFLVTPQRPGHYALLLRVTAKIMIPGFGERPFDVAVLDRAIQVTTTGEAVAEEFTEQTIPDHSWDEADEQAVHQALLLGRVDRAIERIINFVQDKDNDFRDTLLLLQFRWNDNSNQLERQLITTSDWDKVNNQVRLAITKLLQQLRDQFKNPTIPEAVNWQNMHTDLKSQME